MLKILFAESSIRSCAETIDNSLSLLMKQKNRECKIELSTSIEETLQKSKEFKPDIIVLGLRLTCDERPSDSKLDELNRRRSAGFWLIPQIKKLLPSSKLIIWTLWERTELKEMLEELGMSTEILNSDTPVFGNISHTEEAIRIAFTKISEII